MNKEIIKTGINTRVNSKYRISSIYRNWGIMECPDYCGWETIIWILENPDDKMEHIAHSESTNGNAQNVVERHHVIYNRIIENDGEWKDESDDE